MLVWTFCGENKRVLVKTRLFVDGAGVYNTLGLFPHWMNDLGAGGGGRFVFTSRGPVLNVFSLPSHAQGANECKSWSEVGRFSHSNTLLALTMYTSFSDTSFCINLSIALRRSG